MLDAARSWIAAGSLDVSARRNTLDDGRYSRCVLGARKDIGSALSRRIYRKSDGLAGIYERAIADASAQCDSVLNIVSARMLLGSQCCSDYEDALALVIVCAVAGLGLRRNALRILRLDAARSEEVP